MDSDRPPSDRPATASEKDSLEALLEVDQNRRDALLKKVPVGKVLADKYRVERILGWGGMGVVAAARHVQLREAVAVKFLLKTDPIAQARFLREARAAARIRSEHVARVFDIGQLDDGTQYLVMEFLEGCDLDEIVKQDGPLPVDKAIEYTLQACAAMAAAHARGIIHRDLKPANLFLAHRDDGTRVVKVIDFGISKLIPEAGDRGDEESSKLTASTVVMGSPCYMAPEQMQSARDVDVRADVWGLGATLHFMLTGKAPFTGQSLWDIFQGIVEGVTPLSELRLDVPEALDRIVARCLDKLPEGRFGSVAIFATALEPFAPIGVRPYVERISRILLAGGSISSELQQSKSLRDEQSTASLDGERQPTDLSTEGDEASREATDPSTQSADSELSPKSYSRRSLEKAATALSDSAIDGPPSEPATPRKPWRRWLPFVIAGAAVAVAVQWLRGGFQTADTTLDAAVTATTAPEPASTSSPDTMPTNSTRQGQKVTSTSTKTTTTASSSAPAVASDSVKTNPPIRSSRPRKNPLPPRNVPIPASSPKKDIWADPE